MNILDPILWVGDLSQTNVPHYFPFQKQEVPLEFKASVTEALSFLKTKKYSSIFILSDDAIESLEFLVQAKLYQPFAPRVLVSRDLSENEVREGINRGQVFRFLNWPATSQEIWEILSQSLDQHSMYLSRSMMLRESSHQNKQLEALTNSLEEMVDQRTEFIEASHREEREKLTRERHLIRFIKEIATHRSFEDILSFLRKELRKFHKVGDPILAYRLGTGKTVFNSFHQGHFRQTESTVRHEFPVQPSAPSADLIRYFANQFGRPFVKAYVLPLDLRLTNHIEGGRKEAILLIENSLSEKESGAFFDFLLERSRPLGMAIDRLLLENELTSLSYRWERTFDGMKDPIAIVDVDFRVLRANRKFSEKVAQGTCYQVFAKRDTPCDECPIREANRNDKQGSQPRINQIQIQGRFFQVHSYPVVFEESEQSTNFVNQYVDVTQSRELYLRMLQNEKMGAIGMLAGNIAHELNNPLTGLHSLAQIMIMETEAGTTLHSDLKEIEKAALRSQKIIKNLLDFSSGEAQTAEKISVDEVVARTLPMLKSVLRSHRTDIQLNASQSLVLVEPNMLQQVVFNLINNACQAMKDPGTLSVYTGVEGPDVLLTIADTGPGIPPDLKQKVFEPFFTTKKEGHGTGLGLSMSKSIIEKFNGTIEIQDVEPHGCAFKIRLPTVS